MKARKPNPKAVNAAIYEVIDNQLRDGVPPETRQTYERLVAEGHSASEARRLLVIVAAGEIFEMMKAKRPFDRVGYAAALQRLPKLPWER